MKEGHSNSAACRILGIHKNTGRRWLHGRNGVEGLVQQGVGPESTGLTSLSSVPRPANGTEEKAATQTGKLAGDDELRDYVVACLSKRWSPQQVSWALEERFPGEKHRHLAHETIYRALYQ
ncbi:helix-turn-helix domain-containing protein [Arthrobacter oryzae]|uniref:helix-turn-helix domain-containing protein n=1 Tax=Arthrobacter oryzae TaxID=409290 RepID=UPI00352E47DF